MIKRKRKVFLPLAVIAALLLSVFPSASSAQESGREDIVTSSNATPSSLQSYVEDMAPGWNLGNSLDAVGSDETAWGNPPITQQLIQNVAAQGYKSIRIPVTWNAHIGPAPDYTINPAYLNRVEQVVNWALDEDLYVMINLHHDSWVWISHMEQNRTQVRARYDAAWEQIAERFKNHSSKLMMESVNEPRFSDGGTTSEALSFSMLEELNVSFHNIVRSSGGENATRPLVLSTLEASPTQERMDELYDTIEQLDDPNLIATVHFYGFWPFSVNLAGFTTFNQEVRSDITNTFDRVYNTFVARGIPVILGEYGLLGFDKNTDVIQQGEKLKFFEFLGHYLQDKGIAPMLWDNGQHFGRQSFTWSDPDLFAVLKAGWTGRSATGNSDLLFLRAGESITDKPMPMNWNGHGLVSLKAGATALLEGEDYTISGNTLTLKAGTLQGLISNNTHGQQAVLTAKFSGGADWKWHIIVYDTPQLGSATGTTNSFQIPTQFKGDRLATMEAVYTSGGNAGPHDWTSFKEFHTTFVPQYNAQHIQLQPEFFNSVRDGQVKLTFHFWSGAKLDYYITKSGNSVTGQSQP